MKKILVIGKNGQIGRDLTQRLARAGEVIAKGSDEISLINPDSIRRAIREIAPHIIINAAAYTSVDQAEKEPDLATAINATAPGIIAEEAKAINALLVHYSTDYIFDGKKTTPYTESDLPNPLNVYGKTKLAGEKAVESCAGRHFILRTSWVYSDQGKNFLLTILRLAQEKSELKIVADQIGTPNWSQMVGSVTHDILQRWIDGADESKCGTYHLTAKGQTSWFGFAKNILSEASLPELANRSVPRKPILVPITTADYPLPATRPAYSVMSNEKLVSAFGINLPNWETSLHACFEHSRAEPHAHTKKIVRSPVTT